MVSLDIVALAVAIMEHICCYVCCKALRDNGCNYSKWLLTGTLGACLKSKCNVFIITSHQL